MPEIIDLGSIKLKFLQSGLIPAPAPTAQQCFMVRHSQRLRLLSGLIKVSLVTEN
jgi:hypothetical protein